LLSKIDEYKDLQRGATFHRQSFQSHYWP
jgi:hypothetical protein